LIETKGLIGVIAATDAAAKAAAVVIATAELTDDAYMTIKIEGELSAVRAAVDAGARAAEHVGELVAAHVIPRPDQELGPLLPPRRYISKYHPDDDRPSLGFIEQPEPPKPRAPEGGVPSVQGPSKKRRAPKHEKRVAPVEESKPTPPPVQEQLVEKAPPPGPPAPTIAEPTLAELEKMPVVKLRQYARTVKGLPIKGRQISMANKDQLLEAIKSFTNTE
jgi:hypothetical protein